MLKFPWNIPFVMLGSVEINKNTIDSGLRHILEYRGRTLPRTCTYVSSFYFAQYEKSFKAFPDFERECSLIYLLQCSLQITMVRKAFSILCLLPFGSIEFLSRVVF